ncbi:hypothetical protein ACX0G9_16250 [Flavitalea flava]
MSASKPKPAEDPPPIRHPSKKRALFFKGLLFRGISLLIPILVLGLLELSLRFFHYGQDLGLFIESPADKNFLVLNPAASKKYFSDQEIAPTGNLELFRKKKEENTLRIFVLGESTTIGYPYFHNGSFHRWLQYRLMHTFPDRQFEIINLSLTAVNSYTVLGFAREVTGYQPDAILIYTGHNEYYGALGVGSTQNIGGSTAVITFIMALRQLRLTQLITHTYEAILRTFGSSRSKSGMRRMELMVGDQQISYGSKLFDRGIEQFRSNMEETLQILTSRHIPVFISNLVSNEKDLPPFISIQADSLGSPRFAQNYASGRKAFEKEDWAGAYGFFLAANQAYPAHALCNFYLGRLAFRLGDSTGAKTWFSRARDLDALRFRAPDSLNTIISTLCHKYAGAELVDTRTAFEARSPGHITGDELILEHVHPNLAGYALLSDVFYEAMKQRGLFRIGKEKEMSYQELLQTMPITEVDSLTGAYKIASLKKGWPFKNEKNTDEKIPGRNPEAPVPAADFLPGVRQEEKLANKLAFSKLPWLDAMNELYAYYIQERDLVKAKKVLEGLVLEYPLEESYYEKTANICGELRDNEQAAFYFKKAFSLSPSFDMARYLFVIYLKMDRPDEAIPYLDYAIRNNVSGLNLAPVKQFAQEIGQSKKNLEKDTANLAILNQIAVKYIMMGNKEAGLKYAGKILEMEPGNKEALSLVIRLKSLQ